jgi:hypothetical protein
LSPAAITDSTRSKAHAGQCSHSRSIDCIYVSQVRTFLSRPRRWHVRPAYSRQAASHEGDRQLQRHYGIADLMPPSRTKGRSLG